MMKLPNINFNVVLVAVVSWMAANFFMLFYPVLFWQPKFLLALPIAFCFLIFLMINPEGALIVILLVRPALDHMLEGTRLGGSGGFGIGAGFNLAILLLFVMFLFKNQGLPKSSPFNRWWIFFLLATLPSVFYSPFVFRAIRLYSNYITYFAMMTLPFLIVKTRVDYKKYLNLLLVVVIAPLVIGLVDMAKGGTFATRDAGLRVVGAFTHPNILAYFLVFGLVLYFYTYISERSTLKKKSKFWFIVIGILMITVLFGTKTRSAWIACFLGFFVYGILKDRKLLLWLFIIGTAACFVPQVQERIQTLLSDRGGPGEYQGLNSFVWRLQAWQMTLGEIFKNPIQGYGLSSFFRISNKFSTHGESFGAHNVYLEFWFETGFLGMVSYLVLLMAPIFEFWKIFKTQTSDLGKRLAALMVGYTATYLLITLSDNLAYYLAFNWYYWFFVGLTLVGLRLEIEEAKKVKQG